MVKTVAIVSLSSGIIGEQFLGYEIEIGLKRLQAYGLAVKMMDNTCRGLAYLKQHPEARAQDLIQAFRAPEVDMILCAIGGDDTYRLLPYLFEHDELAQAVSRKIFLGFSDTTINHLMLHKVGLPTFYGQAFLPDLCELGHEMLPYSASFFEELIQTGTIREIRPSDLWYEERTSFSPDQVGIPRIAHPNQGFQLLQGPARFSGPILGGCVESLYDIFTVDRYPDTVTLCSRYSLFPSLDDWRGKILLLESSEEKPKPEQYRIMLNTLKQYGLFDVVSGVLVGKPMDETYANEYRQLLVQEIANPRLPILFNLNVGHATPRCIIPFGVPADVDADQQVITFHPDVH